MIIAGKHRAIGAEKSARLLMREPRVFKYELVRIQIEGSARKQNQLRSLSVLPFGTNRAERNQHLSRQQSLLSSKRPPVCSEILARGRVDPRKHRVQQALDCAHPPPWVVRH